MTATSPARIGVLGGGREWLLPIDDEMTRSVMPGVAAVKRNDMAAASALLRPVAYRLEARGIDVLVLGCTEIPLAFGQVDGAVSAIDATEALARATVAAALRLGDQQGVEGR